MIIPDDAQKDWGERMPVENLFFTAIHKGQACNEKQDIPALVLQKLLADPKTSKISQYLYSFQLAKTRTRTNPHCYA